MMHNMPVCVREEKESILFSDLSLLSLINGFIDGVLSVLFESAGKQWMSMQGRCRSVRETNGVLC